MRTRIIALIVALVLAVVGGALIIEYVRGADARAVDGAQLTNVLVVTKQVPPGTGVDELVLLVEQRSIPSAFLAEGAISDLAELTQLSGLVTTATLVPGEQVVRERLATPEDLVNGGGAVQVPEGLQEITVSLDAPRILGGHLAPGDTVGIFVSVEGDGVTPRQTRPLLEQVLVTAVDGGSSVAQNDAVTSSIGTVTVTLAVSEADAQAIIYAREFAQLWFSKQNADTLSQTAVPFTFTELVG